MSSEKEVLELKLKIQVLTSSIIQLIGAVSDLRFVTHLIVNQGHTVTRQQDQELIKKNFGEIEQRIGQSVELLERVINMDNPNG